MQMNTFIISALLAGIVAIGGFAYWTTRDTTSATQMPATTTPDTVSTATSTTVKIALLDTTGNGTGKSRGCDNVTMVSRTVPKTTAPLTAAMQSLFAEKEGTQPSATYNFIARTKNTLKFDHATVASGTANIYLTGSLSGLAGICDDPRAQIQIEETALQFATVQKVQIYLNNKATTLTPSEKGE
jgi:hypothetical protein